MTFVRKHKLLMLVTMGLAIVILTWVVKDWNAPRHQGRTAEEWFESLASNVVTKSIVLPPPETEYNGPAKVFEHFGAEAAPVLRRGLRESCLMRSISRLNPNIL